MAKADLSCCGIYCIRNLVSGRVYVGSSINIYNRWKSHRSLLNAGEHNARAMQRSWLKHGPEAFEFSIIEHVQDPQMLVAREQFWIDHFNSANSRTGFNSSPTAGNCLGVRHSAETRRKQSAARKGKSKSAEHRAAIGAAHKGRRQSDAICREKSERMRRWYAEHPEARERMREVGKRNGAASKGRKLSAAERANMSASRRESAKCLESARANIAKANAAITSEMRSANGRKSTAVPRYTLRRFTFADAELIRARKAEGATYDQLEAEFGLNRSSLSHIVHRRTYQRP